AASARQWLAQFVGPQPERSLGDALTVEDRKQILHVLTPAMPEGIADARVDSRTINTQREGQQRSLDAQAVALKEELKDRVQRAHVAEGVRESLPQLLAGLSPEDAAVVRDQAEAAATYIERGMNPQIFSTFMQEVSPGLRQRVEIEQMRAQIAT